MLTYMLLRAPVLVICGDTQLSTWVLYTSAGNQCQVKSHQVSLQGSAEQCNQCQGPRAATVVSTAVKLLVAIDVKCNYCSNECTRDHKG